MAVAPVSGSLNLEVFARGTNNQLWHKFQPGPGQWSDWESLGGNIRGGPSVVRHAGGGLEVFCLGADGALWHIWQQANGWGSWESLGGGLVESPLAVMTADNRLAVFAKGRDGQLWHIFQTDFFHWSDWQPTGPQIVGTPVCTFTQSRADGGGCLTPFVRVTDGTLRMARQTDPGDHRNWSGFRHVTGPVTADFDVFPSQDGRMEIFFPSVNGEMRHMFQLDPFEPFSFSQPGSFAGDLRSKPAAIKNRDGRLEVFHIGLDKRVYNAWQESPNGRWAGWHPQPLNNLIGFPCVGINTDGRLEVFAVNDVHDLVHMWQPSAGGDPWGYGNLGGQNIGGIAELGRCSMWNTTWAT